MRIGIDIDGVLTDIGQFVMDHLSKYCFENNIKYSIENKNYDWCKTFQISKEKELDFLKENLEDYAIKERIRPFASNIIRKLKEEGHEIYIITARWLTNRDDEQGRKMKEIVKNWLQKNNVIYDQLIFSKAMQESKKQEIIDYKIDVMIDDSPHNIEELSSLIPVICYHTEYNQHCRGDNVIRCYSWYDIYSKIKSGKIVVK